MRAVMSGHGELVWPCNEGVRGVRGVACRMELWGQQHLSFPTSGAKRCCPDFLLYSVTFPWVLPMTTPPQTHTHSKAHASQCTCTHTTLST
jgi:hypothetical protein